MKKFFKKIVNKVKEVIHMAVKAVNEAEMVKAEAIIHAEDLVADGVKGAANIVKDTANTFGVSFCEYLENKDNIKAAEKEKVVDVVEDVLKGTVNVVKAIDRNPLKMAVVCVGLGGIFIGIHLVNKLA